MIFANEDERLPRKPPRQPGEPFVPLSEAEAEWLVLFGWHARKRARRWDPPPPASVPEYHLSEPEDGEEREILDSTTCR